MIHLYDYQQQALDAEARHLTAHGDIKHVRDIKRWAQKIEVGE